MRFPGAMLSRDEQTRTRIWSRIAVSPRENFMSMTFANSVGASWSPQGDAPGVPECESLGKLSAIFPREKSILSTRGLSRHSLGGVPFARVMRTHGWTSVPKIEFPPGNIAESLPKLLHSGTPEASPWDHEPPKVRHRFSKK